MTRRIVILNMKGLSYNCSRKPEMYQDELEENMEQAKAQE
jgi:hypothetical protein